LNFLSGYEKYPLVSLEQAIEPLRNIINQIEYYVYIAKKKTKNPKQGLTHDEAASIMLYTMEWEPSDLSLYSRLNQALRSEDRQRVKPYIYYLKLILTALCKLPSYKGVIWRGVKFDISASYHEGQRAVWWGFTSATADVQILNDEQFLGTTGNRTLFAIECKNAKQISEHSVYSMENELLLMPGFHFEVMSILHSGNDMHIINLKEISPH
jgi:hypothetical protein